MDGAAQGAIGVGTVQRASRTPDLRQISEATTASGTLNAHRGRGAINGMKSAMVPALACAGSAFAAVPKNIRIGTDPTYAPFESKNASGELVGFDIDLAKDLCKRIEAKCTFVESDFDALIPTSLYTSPQRLIRQGLAG